MVFDRARARAKARARARAQSDSSEMGCASLHASRVLVCMRTMTHEHWSDLGRSARQFLLLQVSLWAEGKREDAIEQQQTMMIKRRNIDSSDIAEGSMPPADVNPSIEMESFAS